MALNDVFDAFEKEDKPTPEKVAEIPQAPESKSVPIPGEADKTDDKIVEDVPSLKAEEVDDFFVPALDEPAKEEPTKEEPADDKPAEDQSVKEEVTSETPTEETPATDAPAVVDDDWFEPAEEQAPAGRQSEESAGEIVPMSVEVSPIVVPAVTAEVMRASMQQFQKLKASLLDKNKDIATIQNKPYVKRSGWRKLALAFNISDDIIKEKRDEIEDGFLWRIWVKVWAPNGRSVVGIGACSSDERNFAHVQHDLYATAHTRAKNRALSDMIGSGEVSWEELRSFDS